jgi:hypothetical protein
MRKLKRVQDLESEIIRMEIEIDRLRTLVKLG